MAEAKARETGVDLSPSERSSCLSLEAFHHYVSIASSRAVVLRGSKRLTPLADMANFAPRNDGRPPSMSQYFTLYHNLDPTTGVVAVRADRPVRAGEQIFEDYGDTDNLLCLEAHGFAPDENPFHCAMISGREGSATLPAPSELSEGLRRALVKLNVLPPASSAAAAATAALPPDVCVKRDGTVTDERSSAYLTVAALGLDPSLSAHRASCEEAASATSGDSELLRLLCVRYPGHAAASRKMVRRAARGALCASPTTLEEDWKILSQAASEANAGKSVGEMMGGALLPPHLLGAEEGRAEVTEEDGRRAERRLIALKFRIVEKRTLADAGGVRDAATACGGSADLDSDGEQDAGDAGRSASIDMTESPDASPPTTEEDLVRSLEEFESFLSTLNIPVNELRPALVGDGLRLGAVPASNLTADEPYFTIAESSTISVDTASRDTDNRALKVVLEKYHSNPDDDGGFTALLLYLLHEKFATGEKSKWHPYLQLLPTVEEMRSSGVPLFLSEGALEDGPLRGSDVRRRILSYKRRASELHGRLSSDYDAVSAVGRGGANGGGKDKGYVLLDLDKFLWAHATLDSRSIWWDGKRHLVPLLDLVNCREVYDDRTGEPNPVHRTAPDGSGNAVTLASMSFAEGEQVYENYGQPDHTYYTYHGFILGGPDRNSHDCALWEGGDDVSIQRDDPAVVKDPRGVRSRQYRFGFRSPSPSFCVGGGDGGKSLDRVADFLRIKLGLPGEPGGGLGPDVFEAVRDALRRRLARYDRLGIGRDDADKTDPETTEEPGRTATRLVRNEREHFARALEGLESRVKAAAAAAAGHGTEGGTAAAA